MRTSDYSYITKVVCAYWVVSISMVYVNKVLLSSERASIPAPFFVTWFQCIVTCGLCYVLGEAGAYYTSRGEQSVLAQFPRIKVDMNQFYKILPLSVVFVSMVTFNNICLKYVEVSFYNVARSLTLVFNVILTFVMLGQTTSLPVLGTLLVVILGFVVGIDGEVNFSLMGTLAGVMSSLFVALNSIYTAKMLPMVDNDKSKLLFANNWNATFLFIPLILIFEYNTLQLHWDKLGDLLFWSLMSVAGVFGFLIGLVTVMQVKATSALTHNISGTAKAAVQSLMAFYIWGNEMTTMAVLGILLVLGGSFLYAYARMMKDSAPIKVGREQKV